MATFGLVIQMAFTSFGVTGYAEAHKQVEDSGRPLLVLVGADWCPGCRAMKQQTLPQMERAGKLDGVIFTMVNTEQEPEIARKLMRGGTIPQLILFTKTDDGWKRKQLTGAHDIEQISVFLKQSMIVHRAPEPSSSAAGGN